MKKQIIFIIASILTCITLILTIKEMYSSIGGIELGHYLTVAVVTIIYTIYTIYYLFTLKIYINTKNIQLILLVYWLSIFPFLSMWIWELL